jgi:predicted ATPase
MITRFKIDNFKSLVDFELPPAGYKLGGFTCLIGLNGAGKSTLLQAFDFIAQIATGGIQPWLEHREWKKGELVSNLGKKTPVINFTVGFQNATGSKIEWTARFNTTQLRCTAEMIVVGTEPVLILDEGRLKVGRVNSVEFQEFEKVPFEYQGSVLSTLKLADARPEIAEVKAALQGLHSLELLSPQLMRKKARSAHDIGASGEKLSPFLDQLPFEQQSALLGTLKEFYPQLRHWSVKGYRAGWKSLRIFENYAKQSAVDAGHINDGFLRVIAILSQQFTDHRVLLLDEIENGINPALVEKLMDFLVDLGRRGKQIVVTTHSPVILNYLDDDVAREGVILLYKTDDGRTQACRYFDQAETGYKLKALGPGEVFVDTDLTKLVARLAAEAAPAATNTGSEK